MVGGEVDGGEVVGGEVAAGALVVAGVLSLTPPAGTWSDGAVGGGRRGPRSPPPPPLMVARRVVGVDLGVDVVVDDRTRVVVVRPRRVVEVVVLDGTAVTRLAESRSVPPPPPPPVVTSRRRTTRETAPSR